MIKAILEFDLVTDFQSSLSKYSSFIIYSSLFLFNTNILLLVIIIILLFANIFKFKIISLIFLRIL